MKLFNLNFLFCLVLTSIFLLSSCSQENTAEFLDSEPAQQRSISSDYSIMDETLSILWNSSEEDLLLNINSAESRADNDPSPSNIDFLQDFGVPYSLAVEFTSIEWDNYIDSEGEFTPAFVDGYGEYICDNGTLINVLSDQLDDSVCEDMDVAGLWGWLCGDDPCNACNTADAIFGSAITTAVGCGLGGPIGCGVALIDAADNVISYGQDCG